MFQKHGTFNFGYQFWFLGPTTIIFTKLMLYNIILIIIIIFIIYIEGSMSIFTTYIGIIGPKSCFDCIKFRVSLIIKIINFTKFLKMPHLTMLVVFYVDVIFFQNFNLPHIYCIFALKAHFFKMKIYKLVTWYPNMIHIMWNDMVQYTFNFHKY